MTDVNAEPEDLEDDFDLDTDEVEDEDEDIAGEDDEAPDADTALT